MLSSFCICGVSVHDGCRIAHMRKKNQILYLWGMVQFHTGGKVREHASAEQVRFLHRQYSLDEKR